MTFNRWSEMTTINIPSVKEARAAAAEEPVLFPDPAQITDEYLALSYRYRFLFGTFLIDETGMDSFDERLAGRGIAACGDDEKDFYQKYDSLSLKYFYIRGIARVERLDEKDRDRLSLLFTKNDDGSWFEALEIIVRTFGNVMAVDPKAPEEYFEPKMTLFKTFLVKGGELPLALRSVPEFNDKGMLVSREADEKRIGFLNSLREPVADAISQDIGRPVRVSVLYS